MSSTKVLTLICSAITFLLFAVSFTSGNELFGYREDPEDNPGRQNARNRTPVYIPGRCGMNEILYPGDQESDWVCDCRPAHVYHPLSNGCYPLYTQAYCAQGEYVKMPLGEKLPKCVPNTCPSPQIPFDGQCVQLHKNNAGKCPTINRIKYVVGVNETTLQLECISQAPINLARIPSVPDRRMDPSDKDAAVPVPVANQQQLKEPVIVTADGKVLFPLAMKCALGSAGQITGQCEQEKDNKST